MMAKQVVDALIDRHHGVKDAWLRIPVELQQDAWFTHGTDSNS